MKLWIMSDVHNEFTPLHLTKPHQGADMLVLAGDIDVGTRALDWINAAGLGMPVIYIPGNHEFYGKKIFKTMGSLVTEADGTAIHCLNDSRLEWRGVRFLCATLWTDFDLYEPTISRARAMDAAGYGMMDYRRIVWDVENDRPGAGYHRFQPRNALELHQRARKFLEDRLREPFAGKTVVVTHMAPSMRSIPEQFAESTLNPAYASHLDALIIATKPALWIHGHTHTSFDYMIGETRVVCNPRGYVPDEPNPAFDPKLVIEV